MPDKKIKILVTGGAGFVGSVLCPMLLEKDYSICVVDNFMYGSRESLTACLGNANFELKEGDIRDKDFMLKSIKDVDYIIHLAAVVGEPNCKKNPELCYSINTGGTEIINNLRSPHQKIIFASTGTIYGKVEGVCVESCKPNQLLSDYSKSKAAAEQIISQKDNYVIYRFSTGFGLSPCMRTGLLIHDFILRALKEKSNVIYEAGAMRTFIHVKDMARSFIFAIENFENMKNEAYNVGSDGLTCTKGDLAKKIKNIVDYNLEYAEIKKDPDQRDYKVSFEKIGSKGFKTIIGLDEGIRELISHFL